MRIPNKRVKAKRKAEKYILANELVENPHCNSGKQFPPEFVTAFCRAMLKESKGDKFRRMPGKDYLSLALSLTAICLFQARFNFSSRSFS